jgi:DNA (cytosine-5)-methyltransferase 1
MQRNRADPDGVCGRLGKDRVLRIAGLFAGIGGFELGMHAAGHQSVMLCEIKPEATAVLEARFPGVSIERDILRIRALPKNVDLVCAGFPCQDLSQAGRTNGLGGANSGLVHEVFRLLAQRRVPWVVLENVPFMLQLQEGQAMWRIVEELERLGYRWAYRVVDTFSFGLPQRRERVFLVASLDGDPENVLLADDRPLARPETALGSLAHGFYWTEGTGGLGWAVDAVPTLKNRSTIGIPSPPAILMPSGRIIKPDIRDTERMQGFPADWTQPAEMVARVSHRWSLVGSAVSVPVSRWLGRRLSEPGEFDPVRCGDFPEAGKLPRAACGDRTGRCSVNIGTDPIGIRPPHLATFLLHEGSALSLKATSGFYRRARAAKLRFAEGFLDAVERHLAFVSEMPAGSGA